jgi:hypothetical protein
MGLWVMETTGELMTREQVAETWLREDYEPIVEALREAGMIGADETETEAYMRVVADRYRLMRTHEWDEDVLERLRRERR